MINSTQNNPASTKNAETHSVYVFCDYKSQENMKQYHESALFFSKNINPVGYLPSNNLG
jgi:hypothetical protein